MTPLSRVLAERDALDMAAWHSRMANRTRVELMSALSRPAVVPMHALGLAAEHRVRLAYVLAHLLEWWRR